jgi:alkanesulfonate monooxygenase SsuD/methylene tetrahydromethanopterin reductase-like flavin-dependent oxidoreductase (luciferase family)
MGNALDIELSNELSFGITVNLTGGAQAPDVVRQARTFGYQSIWAGDHIAAHVPINDPLIQLAYLAALAPELRYGTSVYLLPLRPPAVVAKLVATIDRLIGAGRFIFGVGVGGEFVAEYKACGIEVRQRGGRTDEALAVLRRLWTESPVEHHGKYFDFPSLDLKPKPIRSASVSWPTRRGGAWIGSEPGCFCSSTSARHSSSRWKSRRT